MRRGHRFRGARARQRVGPGEWAVRARVERFGEPALLLLLSERPAHGYDLLEQLPELTGERRIDMGNLYRVLRALEEDGIVRSEWRDDAPGPSKRIYELTDEGRRLLGGWADALRTNQELVSSFLDRYEKGGDHVPRT
jgi:PadR family transcriptional regulator, regulatory protein PadR